MLTDCEAADAVEIHRRIQQGIEIGEKRSPRLRRVFRARRRGHGPCPQVASCPRGPSVRPRVNDAGASISGSDRAFRPSRRWPRIADALYPVHPGRSALRTGVACSRAEPENPAGFAGFGVLPAARATTSPTSARTRAQATTALEQRARRGWLCKRVQQHRRRLAGEGWNRI